MSQAANSVTRLKLYHQSVTKSTKLNLNLLESLSRAKPHSLFVPERDHTADALHQYCGKRQLQLELWCLFVRRKWEGTKHQADTQNRCQVLFPAAFSAYLSVYGSLCHISSRGDWTQTVARALRPGAMCANTSSLFCASLLSFFVFVLGGGLNWNLKHNLMNYTAVTAGKRKIRLNCVWAFLNHRLC